MHVHALAGPRPGRRENDLVLEVGGMPNGMERRAGPRVPVKMNGLGCLLGTDGHVDGDVFAVDVLEVGTGGVRVDVRGALSPGQPVHLICRLGQFRAVPVVAEVVWSRGADSPRGQAGLRFTSNRDHGTTRLITHCLSPEAAISMATA